MKLVAGVAVLCLAVLGCQRSKPSEDTPAGHERGDCRPDKTCEPGLWCLSNLCVRPPPADCKAVAEQLVSLELGNYAEPEDRAPLVEKYAASCGATYVTKEEGQCVDKARDRWTAQHCVPRMFPELGTGAADCAAVVERTKAILQQQSPYLNDPSARKWFDLSIDVMRQSCEQDHWPDAIKQCVMANNLTAAAMELCNQQLPPAMQQAMQARLAKAMQDLRGQ